MLINMPEMIYQLLPLWRERESEREEERERESLLACLSEPSWSWHYVRSQSVSQSEKKVWLSSACGESPAHFLSLLEKVMVTPRQMFISLSVKMNI